MWFIAFWTHPAEFSGYDLKTSMCPHRQCPGHFSQLPEILVLRSNQTFWRMMWLPQVTQLSQDLNSGLSDFKVLSSHITTSISLIAPTKCPHPGPDPLAPEQPENSGFILAQGYHVTDTSFGPIGRKAGSGGYLGAASQSLPSDGSGLLREGHVHWLCRRGQVDGLQRIWRGSPATTEGELIIWLFLVCATVSDVIFIPQAMALRKA